MFCTISFCTFLNPCVRQQHRSCFFRIQFVLNVLLVLCSNVYLTYKTGNASEVVYVLQNVFWEHVLCRQNGNRETRLTWVWWIQSKFTASSRPPAIKYTYISHSQTAWNKGQHALLSSFLPPIVKLATNGLALIDPHTSERRFIANYAGFSPKARA